MLEIAKWQAETSAQHRPVNAAAQWLKSLQHSAQSLVSGRAEEIQEDAEYIKVCTGADAMGSLHGSGAGSCGRAQGRQRINWICSLKGRAAQTYGTDTV